MKWRSGGERSTDHATWFCFASALAVFFPAENTKGRPDFLHWRKNNYSTSGLPSPAQDIYARLSFLSFTIETTFIAGMLGKCYVVCSTLKSRTRKETNCYKFNAYGWIGS